MIRINGSSRLKRIQIHIGKVGIHADIFTCSKVGMALIIVHGRNKVYYIQRLFIMVKYNKQKALTVIEIFRKYIKHVGIHIGVEVIVGVGSVLGCHQYRDTLSGSEINILDSLALGINLNIKCQQP